MSSCVLPAIGGVSALPGVLILDRRGAVIAMNEPWTCPWRGQEAWARDVVAPGVNFLDVGAVAAWVGPADATAALEGIALVCNGRTPHFTLEYRSDVTGDERWGLMTVTPLRHENGGAVVALTDITERKRAETAMRGLSRRLIEAQEQERARIGRELHDNVSQRLALLSIEIDKLWEALPDGADEMAASVARLRSASRDVAREVHDLSHRLHSIKLEALGLVPAVRGHCREVSKHSIQVQFRDANVPTTLRDDAALCVFRIVQEALANVVKHSGAAEARVLLSGGDGEIVLRVEDGGCGFEPDMRRDGIGLMSMRERAHLVGGDITVRSTPNQGTVIEARVPIQGSPIQAGRSLSAA